MNCLFLRGFLSKTKSHCKIARQEVKLTKCQLKPWSRAEIQAIRKNFSKVKATCHVWLFVIPWTVAHQAPLSMRILQARILEWVPMPSSRGSSQPRDRMMGTCQKCRCHPNWEIKDNLPSNVTHDESLAKMPWKTVQLSSELFWQICISASNDEETSAKAHMEELFYKIIKSKKDWNHCRSKNII